MKRILIADDHAIMRDGLKRILDATQDLKVVDEAESGDQVMAKVRGNTYDLVLLDMSMPGKSGIELIKWIKATNPDIPVLVLSMHEEEQYAVRAIRAGASGYVTKDTASMQLVTAIRKVTEGGVYLSQDVAEQIALNLQPKGEEHPHQSLSDREFEVFLLLVEGRAVSDIAERLHLSVKTVSTHKARILEKMGMESVAELVSYAMTHHLIEGTGPD